MESPILAVEEFFAYFGELGVLKDINLSIVENKATAIMGPSGCGKTTLIRCINRMHELIPNSKVSGKILLNGKNLYGMNPIIVRRQIGMVFQRPNPFPTMSIYDNVAFGLKINRYKGDREELVVDALRKAALWDEVKDKLKDNGLSLSGGQQQRLCIARAIVTRPSVLLMDEPCSALDPIATRHIEELMLSLKQEFTIALVTHNMQQARRVADNTAFMGVDISEGRRTGYLVEFGATEQVFEAPREALTQEYMSGKFS